MLQVLEKPGAGPTCWVFADSYETNSFVFAVASLAALVSNWVTMILSHQRRVQESVVLSVSKHVL